jgi:hypothetical protein
MKNPRRLIRVLPAVGQSRLWHEVAIDPDQTLEHVGIHVERVRFRVGGRVGKDSGDVRLNGKRETLLRGVRPATESGQTTGDQRDLPAAVYPHRVALRSASTPTERSRIPFE